MRALKYPVKTKNHSTTQHNTTQHNTHFSETKRKPFDIEKSKSNHQKAVGTSLYCILYCTKYSRYVPAEMIILASCFHIFLTCAALLAQPVLRQCNFPYSNEVLAADSVILSFYHSILQVSNLPSGWKCPVFRRCERGSSSVWLSNTQPVRMQRKISVFALVHRSTLFCDQTVEDECWAFDIFNLCFHYWYSASRHICLKLRNGCSRLEEVWFYHDNRLTQ